jgi:hypothetical protein
MAILNLCRVLFYKNGYQKMEESAGWSSQRVLSWHGKGSEYLEGTAEKMEVVMCD